ncbi:TPA: helix-turn-helix domain-containing protein [Escherichia coli]|nr:helix-turn-helix domain-containing protein [Escherichia coli]HAX4925372.1 helix-turn-helix domain-containing protein [Escherichia coli]HAX4948298.1 helix-turn-helix domain-containing protein [Escherichia coli]
MSTPENIVDDIISWIDNNLDKKLHIDQVAAHAGYSVWHFQRIFSARTGVPLARYIRQRRLKLAARMLSGTDLPVLEICLQYGFASQQTFTRIFTRTFHCPPGEYRKRTRKH